MSTVGQSASASAAATVPGLAPRLNAKPVTEWDRRIWLVAIPLALVVVYAFIPTLDNGFVMWDDYPNFLENQYFRGLGSPQVKWAWTTFLLGVYQPLAWLLFETEYLLYQLDPRGYHLTSLILQVANTVCLYFLTVALLVRCRTDCCLESTWTCYLSAGLATALFAVHPLRVEAVAWASCQPYLPCALFAILSVLAYLHAVPTDSPPRTGWLVGSFLLFVAALLFKALAVSLPAVLLILDVYPLRRFPDKSSRWFGASTRKAVLEKSPFVMMSLLFIVLAISAKTHSRIPADTHSAWAGIARACHAICFYPIKTVLPLNLIPLHPSPVEVKSIVLLPSVGSTILATLAVSAGLFLLRRRCPGLITAWLSYLVILAPTSGLISIAEQISADRYSYMCMLSSVTPSAAGLCWLGRLSSRRRPAALGVIAISLGTLLGLIGLTRNQCRTWRDSDRLLTYALNHGLNSYSWVHHNLGIAFYRIGKYDKAVGHLTEAVRLGPGDAKAHNALGRVLYSQGKYDEAAAHFTDCVRLNPDDTNTYNQLGTVLAHQKRFAEAEAHFAQALRRNPSLANVHFNVGRVCVAQGKYHEAAAHYADVIRLEPNHVGGHYSLGNALVRLGNYADAIQQYMEAIRLDRGFAEAYNAIAIVRATSPEEKFRDAEQAVRFATRGCELTKWNEPRFLNTLAAAESEAGEFSTAVSWQKRAIELLRDDEETADYRSRLVLYQAKKPYRQIPPARSDRITPVTPHTDGAGRP